MHHKYPTRAIVVARHPLAEAGALLVLLTDHLGLLTVRAAGLRKSQSKLAHALQTLCESDLMLVRGREGWRLTGAILVTPHAPILQKAARLRAARLSDLMLRLVHGESPDSQLFVSYAGFVRALPTLSEEHAETAECLAALRMLGALGFDAGEAYGEPSHYDEHTLTTATGVRSDLVARVNRGIAASGL
jgi:DNA repair protein RecO